MLVVESGPFGRRLRLLETIRQLGAEHLSAAGSTDLIAARHACWCRDEVTRIRQLLEGPAEIEGAARLEELWPNLRAAVEWACATGDRRLAHALVAPIATEVYLRSRTEIGDWAERILAITPPDDEALILFGVIWASRRYMRNMDIEGYERLVERYGEPDHPMVRYARGFLHDDYDVMLESAPPALAELRQRGAHYVADLTEIAALGRTLLMTGRLEEHDALMTAAVERHRANGPPTSLQWALTYLGFSASVQGRHREAWELFDEANDVDVPEGTHTMKNPLEARAALRRGDRARAARVLAAFVDELLDTDNMFVAKNACIEFVHLMVTTDQLSEAACIVGFLESSGTLDLPAFRSLVADDAKRVAADAAADQLDAGRDLDDRRALTYIREVLRRPALRR